jgi:GDPmannose 4,6-dehydratase
MGIRYSEAFIEQALFKVYSRGERAVKSVAVDQSYFWPTEVETLLGDPSKAKNKLGWVPKITFKELVAEMVREDLKAAERDELVKQHSFCTLNYHE